MICYQFWQSGSGDETGSEAYHSKSKIDGCLHDEADRKIKSLVREGVSVLYFLRIRNSWSILLISSFSIIVTSRLVLGL